MPHTLSIAMLQPNVTVGDLTGNEHLIATAYMQSAAEGAQLVVTPEMAVTGYPPEDLVLRKSFVDEAHHTALRLATLTKNGPPLLLGSVYREGGNLYNAALLLQNGIIEHIQYKHHLPNYGVFDEKRIFDEGPMPSPMRIHGLPIGVMICEDMWHGDVSSHLQAEGASLLICMNASPFEANKHQLRLTMAREKVTSTNLCLLYVNQVGGQDELVFRGHSFVMNPDGAIAMSLPAWKSGYRIARLTCNDGTWSCAREPYEAWGEDINYHIYQAVCMGLADYVRKNGFPGVVIGLSGGIDSALTAAIAVDALGADKVHGIIMPSRFNAKESMEDAVQCATSLGMSYETISIEPLVEAFTQSLKNATKDATSPLWEENIQSRIRGNLLMAYSNANGAMVLTTGNKSEMAVGYATLYGDMCGGYNVLKDIYKTKVYELSYWRNSTSPDAPAIPERVLTKVPSAELRENQSDQDSLPDYAILDDILYKLIEERASTDTIIDSGHDAATVKRVALLVKMAEYKRRQAPPGVKLSALAFGRDRRYPITHHFDF